MGFYRIALLFSSVLVSLSSCKEYVPALLLSSTETPSNSYSVPALSKLSSDGFIEDLLKVIDNDVGSRPPIILVFAEESLSVEDFSWANVGDYGIYPRLVNITKPSNSLFFPAVHQPLKALESLVQSGFKWKKYTPTQLLMAIAAGGDKIIPIISQDTKGVVVYVDMEDANPSEDRPDMLRRHDTFIVDAFEKLKGDREVVIVYTASHSSWYGTEAEDVGTYAMDSEDEDYVREIRSSARHLLAEPTAKPNEGGSVLYYANKTILLYSDSAPVSYNGSDSSGLELTGTPSVTPDSRGPKDQRMSIKFTYPSVIITIRIFFEESKRKYWKLTSLEVEYNRSGDISKKGMTPDKNIEAPIGFSYHCSQDVTFVNSSDVKLVFKGFQVQPFLKPEKFYFGDAYDCVYFFTAPIWSGLFVTFLLGLILTWGLSMIMSIRTMDRFDDPKGKTITIGAAE